MLLCVKWEYFFSVLYCALVHTCAGITSFCLVVAIRYFLLLVSAGSSNASGFCLHVQLLHSHNISWTAVCASIGCATASAVSSTHSQPKNDPMRWMRNKIVLSRLLYSVRLDARMWFELFSYLSLTHGTICFCLFRKKCSFLFDYFESQVYEQRKCTRQCLCCTHAPCRHCVSGEWTSSL